MFKVLLDDNETMTSRGDCEKEREHALARALSDILWNIKKGGKKKKKGERTVSLVYAADEGHDEPQWIRTTLNSAGNTVKAVKEHFKAVQRGGALGFALSVSRFP